MRLDPAAASAGFRLAEYDALPSTNTEALRRARARSDETGPLWIAAQTQTAGRGRRGNAWLSPAGNLHATLLLHDPAPPERAPQLSFVAALAVCDAIAGCAPGLDQRIALKWPNDVLCEGRKLAGILLEGQTLNRRLAVAIGIGVNCVDHPDRADYPATDLAAAGAEVSADDLFVALSASMLRRLRQWCRGDDFSAIRSDWLDRASGIGGEMRVRLADREFFGRGEGLDDSGRLMLRLADGSLQTIAAGEVFALSGSEPSGRSLFEKTLADGAD